MLRLTRGEPAQEDVSLALRGLLDGHATSGYLNGALYRITLNDTTLQFKPDAGGETVELNLKTFVARQHGAGARKTLDGTEFGFVWAAGSLVVTADGPGVSFLVFTPEEASEGVGVVSRATRREYRVRVVSRHPTDTLQIRGVEPRKVVLVEPGPEPKVFAEPEPTAVGEPTDLPAPRGTEGTSGALLPLGFTFKQGVTEARVGLTPWGRTLRFELAGGAIDGSGLPYNTIDQSPYARFTVRGRWSAWDGLLQSNWRATGGVLSLNTHKYFDPAATPPNLLSPDSGTRSRFSSTVLGTSLYLDAGTAVRLTRRWAWTAFGGSSAFLLRSDSNDQNMAYFFEANAGTAVVYRSPKARFRLFGNVNGELGVANLLQYKDNVELGFYTESVTGGTDLLYALSPTVAVKALVAGSWRKPYSEFKQELSLFTPRINATLAHGNQFSQNPFFPGVDRWRGEVTMPFDGGLRAGVFGELDRQTFSDSSSNMPYVLGLTVSYNAESSKSPVSTHIDTEVVLSGSAGAEGAYDFDKAQAAAGEYSDIKQTVSSAQESLTALLDFVLRNPEAKDILIQHATRLIADLNVPSEDILALLAVLNDPEAEGALDTVLGVLMRNIDSFEDVQAFVRNLEALIADLSALEDEEIVGEAGELKDALAKLRAISLEHYAVAVKLLSIAARMSPELQGKLKMDWVGMLDKTFLDNMVRNFETQHHIKISVLGTGVLTQSDGGISGRPALLVMTPSQGIIVGDSVDRIVPTYTRDLVQAMRIYQGFEGAPVTAIVLVDPDSGGDHYAYVIPAEGKRVFGAIGVLENGQRSNFITMENYLQAAERALDDQAKPEPADKKKHEKDHQTLPLDLTGALRAGLIGRALAWTGGISLALATVGLAWFGVDGTSWAPAPLMALSALLSGAALSLGLSLRRTARLVDDSAEAARRLGDIALTDEARGALLGAGEAALDGGSIRLAPGARAALRAFAAANPGITLRLETTAELDARGEGRLSDAEPQGRALSLNVGLLLDDAFHGLLERALLHESIHLSRWQVPGRGAFAGALNEALAHLLTPLAALRARLRDARPSEASNEGLARSSAPLNAPGARLRGARPASARSAFAWQTKTPPSWAASLLGGGAVTALAVWLTGLPGLLGLLLIPGRLWYVLLARSAWPTLTLSMQEDVRRKLLETLGGRYQDVEIYDYPGEPRSLGALLRSPYYQLMPLAYAGPAGAFRPGLGRGSQAAMVPGSSGNVLYIHQSVAFALSEYNNGLATPNALTRSLTRAVAETVLLHELSSHGRNEAKGILAQFRLGTGLSPWVTLRLALLRALISLGDLPQALWDRLGLLRRGTAAASSEPASGWPSLAVRADELGRPLLTAPQGRALAAAFALYANFRQDGDLNDAARELLIKTGSLASRVPGGAAAGPSEPSGGERREGGGFEARGRDRALLARLNELIPTEAQLDEDFLRRASAEERAAHRAIDEFLTSLGEQVNMPRWPFGLEHLRQTQAFLNVFIAQALVRNPELSRLAAALRSRGLKFSEKAIDHISLPYAPELVTRLKQLGFRWDRAEHAASGQVLFRHAQGMFPTVLVNSRQGRTAVDLAEVGRAVEPLALRSPVDPEWLDMKDAYGYVRAGLAGEVDVSKDLDEGSREKVRALVAGLRWPEVELVEDNAEEWAAKGSAFASEKDLPYVQIGVRVGDLSGAFEGMAEAGVISAAEARARSSSAGVFVAPLFKVLEPAGQAGIPQVAYVERRGDVVLDTGFATRREAVPSAPRRALAGWMVRHQAPFLLVFGPVRLARMLRALVGTDWARTLFIEHPDQSWLDHTPMARKFRDRTDGLLGAGAWKYFVDHRTLRFTGEPQVPLIDLVLQPLRRAAGWLPFVRPPKPLPSDFDAAKATLGVLGFVERERYSPPETDWEAQVMWIPGRAHASFFLDKPLDGYRGKVALFSAIWRGLHVFGLTPLPRAYVPPLARDNWTWGNVERRIDLAIGLANASDRRYALGEWRRWLGRRDGDEARAGALRARLDAALARTSSSAAVRSELWRAARALLRSAFLLGPSPYFYHHLAMEGVFEEIGPGLSQDDTIVIPQAEMTAEQSNNAFIARFSKKPWRRQAFSLESRVVAPWAVTILYFLGRLTRQELLSIYESASRHGGRAVTVEGPHYENIDRRLGLQSFDQGRVDIAIKTSSELEGAKRAAVENLPARLSSSAAWLWQMYVKGNLDPDYWKGLQGEKPAPPTDDGSKPAAPAGGAPSEPLRLLPGANPAASLEAVSELAPRASYFDEDGTDVVTFDWRSLKKVWTGGLFRLMQSHMDEAERLGKPNKVRFAFVSDVPGLGKDEMLRTLRAHGLPEGLAGSLILLDAATLGETQVLDGGAIRIPELSLLLGRMLMDRWNAGMLRLRVVVDAENAARWHGDALKVLLAPAAGAGEIVSTSLGLMVAVEGELSERLLDFIRQTYPPDEAKRLLSQVQSSDGRVLLPVTTVEPLKLEEKLRAHEILDIQA